MAEMLNVVSEAGDIIGAETRAKIHRDGLLHREVNVWLYTGRGELIFQHRAPDKDTFPEMLDASAGGHVEIGMDWLDAAVAEIHEETGLVVKPEELQFLRQNRVDFQDAATGSHNRALQNIYAYRYDGDAKDLQVEQGKAMGFEIWPIKDLYDLPPEQSKRFIFPLIKTSYLDIFRQIESLVASKAAPAPLVQPYKHSRGYIILPVELTGLPSELTLGGITYQSKTHYHCSLVALKKITAETEDRVFSTAAAAISDIKPNLQEYLPEFRIAEKPSEHKRTLIVMARVSGLEEVFARINNELQLEIPAQPAHVTLYTMSDGANIGLTSPEELAQKSRPLTVAEMQELQQQIPIKHIFGVDL